MSNNAENNRMIEDLYIDMYPILLRYATNSLRNPHLAEEAVQETFRIACAKYVQLMESPNRQGWLTNALKYVIRNTRRSQTKFNSLFKIITTEAQMSPEKAEDNVLYSEAYRYAALWVSVNKQNLFTRACKSHTEIDCGCRFTDSAFLICDGNHFTVFHVVSSFHRNI